MRIKLWFLVDNKESPAVAERHRAMHFVGVRSVGAGLFRF